jgi:predicted secreted Zn-dependent protease
VRRYSGDISLRVWLTFLVLFYSNSVIASSAVNTQFEYYEIFPKTQYDIKSEIQKNTPIINKNIKFHGSTSWQVEWSITWKKTNGICYLDTSAAKLNVLIKMPRISPKYKASDAVVGSFNKYYEVLLKHENGHMDNGIKALKDIDVLLSNFNSYTDCEVLNANVESSITKVIGKYKRQDIAYDEQTKHGQLQGVSIRKFI